MLSKPMAAALNGHITAELYSANLYLAMAAWCESAGLQGCSHWLMLQYGEETGHALKFYTHILDRGGEVRLQAVPAPPNSFASALDVFQRTLAHEQEVTGRINELYALAVKENDFASQTFLNWFVAEQVEEEKAAQDIIDRLRLAGEDGSALLIVDKELAGRAGGAATASAEA
jgi:ferritin